MRPPSPPAPGPAGALDAARAQPRTLRVTGHRPWSLPDRSWLMGQTWQHLLFAHWRVDPDALRRVVPPGLPLDVRDGATWIGVTPFVVRALRLRWTPPLPGAASFPELNVRTYVTVDDKPGIYFLSLDAGRRLAVAAARRAYRLPYFRARMSVDVEGEEVRYRHERVQRDGPPAAFAGRYRPTGEAFTAAPGSLEAFLTERYCLYTLDERRRVNRADIHHPPWPLQPAALELEVNTMGHQVGIELAGEPLLHLAARQDVVIWRRRPVGPTGGPGSTIPEP